MPEGEEKQQKIENLFEKIALVGVAQWIECQSKNQRVISSVPSQRISWILGQIPSGEHVRGNRSMYLSHIDISLPLFLPPLHSP